MNLNQWAIKWGIPFEAVEDLRRELTAENTDPTVNNGESEAAIQTRVRLEATRVGGRLWRNNVGATFTDTGSFIRFGICNDTVEMNRKLKSADLVGIKPVLITEAHIGHTIGQFWARETKRQGWQFSGDEHETAQLNWLNLVLGLGGDAQFTTGVGTL